jgi:hypothetical protein
MLERIDVFKLKQIIIFYFLEEIFLLKTLCILYVVIYKLIVVKQQIQQKERKETNKNYFSKKMTLTERNCFFWHNIKTESVTQYIHQYIYIWVCSQYSIPQLWFVYIESISYQKSMIFLSSYIIQMIHCCLSSIS